jgi:hypothetical protein
MTMKRAFIAAAAACLLLGAVACTPGQINDTFTAVCTSVPVADAGFQIYASSGKVKKSVMDAERTSVAAAQAICNGARPADVNTSIAAVSRAVTAIAEATRAAKAQAGT